MSRRQVVRIGKVRAEHDELGNIAFERVRDTLLVIARADHARLIGRDAAPGFTMTELETGCLPFHMESAEPLLRKPRHSHTPTEQEAFVAALVLPEDWTTSTRIGMALKAIEPAILADFGIRLVRGQGCAWVSFDLYAGKTAAAARDTA